jgi:PAS domain S-box-containing protein
MVVVRNIGDLPPEAEGERAYWAANGVKSVLSLPLRIGEAWVGYLYFVSTRYPYAWPEHEIELIRSFGRVLAGAAYRKQTDASMRRKEEQLSLAVEAAGIGIWSWDLAHPERSYGSANLSKIHGIADCPQEQALHVYFNNLHPEDRGEMEAALARCAQGEAKDFAVEHRVIWPDGSVHWIEARGYTECDEAGRPQRLIGVLLEITRRKENEAQIEQQRQELLRQARMMGQAEQLGEIGAWEWDIAHMAYYWTPETYRIFGLSPFDYSPRLVSDIEFFVPTSAAMLRNAFRRAQEFGESFDLKLQVVTAQGTNLWVRVAGNVEVVEGRTVRIFGSIQNITLRTQIEAQLRETQKLEAIGQLAGGVAHDFNNLLTTINSLSELSMLYLDKVHIEIGVERVRNYLSEIHRAGQRAADLTQQLLAFSRKQVLHPKVLDLRVEIMRLQYLLQNLLAEGMELVLTVPSSLGLVMADPSQIEQVIINLAINAREAMPRGGTLTIRLLNRTIDEAEARQKTQGRAGHYVVLEVQDNGLGMTPEVQTRLFDPFFTTKTVGAGTGLGLATVYGIVKQSGGMIEVESQLDTGTTFRIFLPQIAPAARDAKTSSAFVRGGTETILLVGDDKWARQGYRAALEVKGYRILEAESGREAITISQSYEGTVHLLAIGELSDMKAGHCANQVHLARPNVLVLIFDREARQSGVSTPDKSHYHYLPQPFTPDMLASKIRDVLDPPASPSIN